MRDQVFPGVCFWPLGSPLRGTAWWGSGSWPVPATRRQRVACNQMPAALDWLPASGAQRTASSTRRLCRFFPKTQNLRDCRSHPPSPAPCLVSGLRAARGGDCCETEMRSTAMLSHAKPAWPCQCQATPTPSLPRPIAANNPCPSPAGAWIISHFPPPRRLLTSAPGHSGRRGGSPNHRPPLHRPPPPRKPSACREYQDPKTDQEAPFASPPRPFPETMPPLLS